MITECLVLDRFSDDCPTISLICNTANVGIEPTSLLKNCCKHPKTDTADL